MFAQRKIVLDGVQLRSYVESVVSAELKKTKAPERFIPKAEVLRRTGVTATTLWGWIKAGEFPAGRSAVGKSPRHRTFWLESEVDAWMQSREKRTPGSIGSLS